MYFTQRHFFILRDVIEFAYNLWHKLFWMYSKYWSLQVIVAGMKGTELSFKLNDWNNIFEISFPHD